MRVCVVGAGGAGLGAARRVLEAGLNCSVFEQTEQIGGTWVYTQRTGKDEYGIPIHTSMYKSLKTNLPKEVMGYPDFPIPEQESSFIPSEDILAFLNQFAQHFQLLPHIKLRHHVKKVKPIEGGWEVQVTDLVNKLDKTEKFDAVMVCNGHYHTPMYPRIPGMETFPGEEMHSHDYREPSCFLGKTVLVIGAGPSGIDLSLEAATTAVRVLLSHRQDINLKNIPKDVELKPEVESLEGSKVNFKDGSSESVDVLFYCTGYKYSFPFLASECGVRVVENAVFPLYKHLLSIEHPTLCFIGLPYYVCAFSLFDLQVRFCLKVIRGEIELPPKDEMSRDTETEMEERKKKGMKSNQFHMMGPMQDDYYRELSSLGGLEPIPPVMAKLHTASSERQLEDLVNFRKDNYRILDEEHFVKVN